MEAAVTKDKFLLQLERGYGCFRFSYIRGVGCDRVQLRITCLEALLRALVSIAVHVQSCSLIQPSLISHFHLVRH